MSSEFSVLRCAVNISDVNLLMGTKSVKAAKMKTPKTSR